MGQTSSEYMGESKTENAKIKSDVAFDERRASQGNSKRPRRGPLVNYAEMQGNSLDCEDLNLLNWNNLGLVSVSESKMVPGMTGLIANVDFKANDVITGYEGKIVKFDPAHTADQTSHDSEVPGSDQVIRGYRKQPQWTILNAGDGNARMTNVGCMANDALGGKYLFPGKSLTHLNNSIRNAIPRDCIKQKILDINSNTGASKKTIKPQYLIANADISSGNGAAKEYVDE